MDPLRSLLSPFFLMCVFMIIELIFPQTRVGNAFNFHNNQRDQIIRRRLIKYALVAFLIVIAFIDGNFVEVIKNPNSSLSWGLMLIVVFVFSLSSFFFEGWDDSTKAIIIQKLLLIPISAMIVAIGLIQIDILCVDSSLIKHASAFLILLSVLLMVVRFKEELSSRLSF